MVCFSAARRITVSQALEHRLLQSERASLSANDQTAPSPIPALEFDSISDDDLGEEQLRKFFREEFERLAKRNAKEKPCPAMWTCLSNPMFKTLRHWFGCIRGPIHALSAGSFLEPPFELPS